MKIFIKGLLITFLIQNHLMASEIMNKTHFFLEIESLNMVMRYKKLKNTDIDKNNEYKYQALPLDECNSLVKVRKNNILELFNVNICNKTFFKK